MVNLAIFASGSGSNAEAIARHFKDHSSVSVSVILSNKSSAGVLDRAARLEIPSHVFSKDEMNSDSFLAFLDEKSIHYIVLAGFLLKIPPSLIAAFPDRIINIHPALLPSYGGKGMYGHFVHDAVIRNKEKESGITIHVVNEAYDEGRHLFQVKVSIEKEDTAESLAQKIHKLEHQHFPKEIEKYVLRTI